MSVCVCVCVCVCVWCMSVCVCERESMLKAIVLPPDRMATVVVWEQCCDSNGSNKRSVQYTIIPFSLSQQN